MYNLYFNCFKIYIYINIKNIKNTAGMQLLQSSLHPHFPKNVYFFFIHSLKKFQRVSNNMEAYLHAIIFRYIIANVDVQQSKKEQSLANLTKCLDSGLRSNISSEFLRIRKEKLPASNVIINWHHSLLTFRIIKCDPSISISHPTVVFVPKFA